MITKYITNGTLDDSAFTGVTVTSYSADDGKVIGQNALIDGTPYFGYLPNEVTEAEYSEWKARIAYPDGVVTVDTATGARTYTGTYFYGMFAGIGIIDKATRQALDAQIDAANATADLARNRIVSSRQFNQGLILKGLDEQAEAVVYGLPETTPQEVIYKKLVANWYFKSNQFESKNPVLMQFAPMLGFDAPEKLNTFFDYCATL